MADWRRRSPPPPAPNTKTIQLVSTANKNHSKPNAVRYEIKTRLFYFDVYIFNLVPGFTSVGKKTISIKITIEIKKQ